MQKRIRYSLIIQAHDAQELLGGEIEVDGTYFGGRRKDRRKGRRGRGSFNKAPVFGIFERNGV